MGEVLSYNTEMKTTNPQHLRTLWMSEDVQHVNETRCRVCWAAGGRQRLILTAAWWMFSPEIQGCSAAPCRVRSPKTGHLCLSHCCLSSLVSRFCLYSSLSFFLDFLPFSIFVIYCWTQGFIIWDITSNIYFTPSFQHNLYVFGIFGLELEAS